MLEISFRRLGGIIILDLNGNVDIDSSNFIEKVAACIENGYPEILCNFEAVNLIDYAGLSVLAIAFKNVMNHKGNIKFLKVPEHIKKIFCMVALDKVFEMFDDERQAIKSFQEDKNISEIKKKNLRRRFKRVPLDIDIEYRPKLKNEAYEFGKILDISAIGVLVFAQKVYPLGELLGLRFSLGGKFGNMEMEGRVVWHVQKDLQPQIYPGMGIEFIHLGSLTQQKILEYVDRNLTSETV